MADAPAQDRALGLSRVNVGGRYFTKYDPNIALDIVERIAEGELLSKITAKDAEVPTVTKSTFLRWVATVPELSSAYSAALQISAHSFEEMAIDKAQRVANAPGSPQNVSAASLLISQYRWSAARRNPTRYSDKGNTQIVVPVNISTTLNLGDQKQTIDVEIPDIYTISVPNPNVEDAEFSEVKDVVEQVELTKQTAKEAFKEMLKPEVPVIGVSHQPILQSKKPRGRQLGQTVKRQLSPRKPK